MRVMYAHLRSLTDLSAYSEETLEDVRVMMEAIQASETELQNDLTAFLELEINFVEQYLAVMQEVKADW